MPFADKADLRSTVKATLGFNSGEVADSVIDDWITLCESDLNRRLRVAFLHNTADLSITGDVVATPSGFKGPKDLYLDTTPVKRVLQRSIEQVRSLQACLSEGAPMYFAVKGDSVNGVALVFAPAPDTTYTGKLTYFRDFTLPGATALLARWPDAYLYGTLIHAEMYLGNDGRVATWEDQYLEAVAGILAEYASDEEAKGVP